MNSSIGIIFTCKDRNILFEIGPKIPYKMLNNLWAIKHVKADFFTWKHLHFSSDYLKIDEFHFRSLFCFKILFQDHVFFLEMSHFKWFEIFEMLHCSYFQKWIGNAAFKGALKVFKYNIWIYKSETFQGKNTWLIWKLENDRKWICSIVGHF